MSHSPDRSDASVVPLTHSVPVADLPAHGRDVEIEATPDERAAIAELCGAQSVDRLEAQFHVAKGGGPLLSVTGRISADVVQTCGVTLEPVAETVDAEISLSFTVDSGTELSDVDVILQEEDPPEPVNGGEIDFGGLAYEYFVLNLNPYPRAPGAEFEASAWQDGAVETSNRPNNPFAALASLKSTENKG